MSLNIGNDAIEAAKSLHQMDAAKPLFEAVRRAMADQAREHMNRALDTHEHRDVAVGYARAMRDIYLAFEAAVHGQRPNQVEKPGPVDGGRRVR